MKGFDVIFVLGGWLVQNADGSWRTTNFEEDDPKAAFGDRLRVEAIPYLLKVFKNTNISPKVVVSGSAGKLADRGAPPVAEVMAHKLEELGVSHDCILKDIESGSTYEQLQTLVSLMKKHTWHRVIILSNRYHLDRVRAMITHAKPLAYLFDLLQAGGLVLESAEGILLASAPDKWEEAINTAYGSSRVQEIVASEQKSVRDIEEGKCRFSFLRLRRAIESDTDFLFNMRNEESVRLSAFSSAPLDIETHNNWFFEKLNNENAYLYIIEKDGEAIGQVRIDVETDHGSIDVAIIPQQRGRGYAAEALKKACVHTFANRLSLKAINAEIKTDNGASQKSFANADFKKIDTGYRADGQEYVIMQILRPSIKRTEKKQI